MIRQDSTDCFYEFFISTSAKYTPTNFLMMIMGSRIQYNLDYFNLHYFNPL
jgi:hypothetical protein